LAELQKFVDARSAEFDRRQKELAAPKNKLKLQADKLSAEARSDLQDQITAMESRAQRFQSDSQAEIDRRKNRLVASMTRKLQPVIERVAKAKGCNAVFYLSESLDARVSPGSTITDEVVNAYNAAHPTPAANPGKRP
jgi:Skp family chaperone for outer membrane proteins